MRRLAELDIEKLSSWYERRSKGLGRELLIELDKVFSVLGRNPKLYQEVRSGTRRAVLRKFPVGVFYQIADDLVHIIAVHHFSQDPSRWRKRK